jgi:hypothetical protein
VFGLMNRRAAIFGRALGCHLRNVRLLVRELERWRGLAFAHPLGGGE